MKRDVCVDATDKPMPAERVRTVFRHLSAMGRSDPNANQSPRHHPCAYASTPRVSRSSPAIPPHISSSVKASFARVEQVTIDKGCNP
jgi:hypothetical protein